MMNSVTQLCQSCLYVMYVNISSTTTRFMRYVLKIFLLWSTSMDRPYWRRWGRAHGSDHTRIRDIPKLCTMWKTNVWPCHHCRVLAEGTQKYSRLRKIWVDVVRDEMRANRTEELLGFKVPPGLLPKILSFFAAVLAKNSMSRPKIDTGR